MKDRVIKNIKQVYKEACNRYAEDRILGTFAKGTVNYGFYEEGDVLEYIVVYLPSFEKICTEFKVLNESFFSNSTKSNVKVIDVRLLYRSSLQQGSDFIECVFTDYRYFNPQYLEVVSEMFFPYQELILHYNLYSRVLFAYHDALEKFWNEDYFNAMRILIAADLYLSGVPCKDCILLKEEYHKLYLWKIKHNEVDNIKDVVQKKIDKLEDILPTVSKKNNQEAEKVLKHGIIELLRLSSKGSNEYRVFCKNLTTKEKQCLTTLIEEVQAEGNFVVQELVSKAKVSRPVCKNMLDKMEKYNIALIKSQGVKGTYVKFFSFKAFLEILHEVTGYHLKEELE